MMNNSSNKTDDRFETETLKTTVYKWLALSILEMFSQIQNKMTNLSSKKKKKKSKQTF